MRQILHKLKNIFVNRTPGWSRIEFFDPEWKQRIQLMSSYISTDDSVVDLGCGKIWLKDFLSPRNKYIGVDYKRRDKATVVCDFNRYEFPNIAADIYFVSGCLEYIKDYESYVGNISNWCNRCIISYCCVEYFSDLQFRRQRAWVNDLTRSQLIDIFQRHGMKLYTEGSTLSRNSIFVFDK